VGVGGDGVPTEIPKYIIPKSSTLVSDSVAAYAVARAITQVNGEGRLAA